MEQSSQAPQSEKQEDSTLITHDASNFKLPPHYITFFKANIIFSIIFISLGLLTGLVQRNLQRMLPYERHHEIPWLLSSLLHGHYFLIGAVIPMTFCLMFLLAYICGGRVIGKWTLMVGYWIYVPTSMFSLLLFTYKAIAFMAVQAIHQTGDLTMIEETAWGGRFGNHPVKDILYTFAHVGMTIGFCIYLVALIFALRPPKK